VLRKIRVITTITNMCPGSGGAACEEPIRDKDTDPGLREFPVPGPEWQIL
jgi:hypothetical protein